MAGKHAARPVGADTDWSFEPEAPAAPVPALGHVNRREPSFDDLVRGTGVMSFSDDRRPYNPRHGRRRPR